MTVVRDAETFRISSQLLSLCSTKYHARRSSNSFPVQVGTVTERVGETVRSAKQGLVGFRADKSGIVHAGLGKVWSWQFIGLLLTCIKLYVQPPLRVSFESLYVNCQLIHHPFLVWRDYWERLKWKSESCICFVSGKLVCAIHTTFFQKREIQHFCESAFGSFFTNTFYVLSDHWHHAFSDCVFRSSRLSFCMFNYIQVSFKDEALFANIAAFAGALLAAKPTGLKKSNYLSISSPVERVILPVNCCGICSRKWVQLLVRSSVTKDSWVGLGFSFDTYSFTYFFRKHTFTYVL